MLQNASAQVLDEIDAQRTLVAVESREFKPKHEPVSVLEVLQTLVTNCTGLEAAQGKTIGIDSDSQDQIIISDKTLVQRILGNMVKNALEASPLGSKVSLRCISLPDGQVEFGVHNPGQMPQSTQQQVFRRSFTTKGMGRGLGTYSMLLLSEYLGGKVGFISEEEKGTYFFARFPINPALH